MMAIAWSNHFSSVNNSISDKRISNKESTAKANIESFISLQIESDFMRSAGNSRLYKLSNNVNSRRFSLVLSSCLHDARIKKMLNTTTPFVTFNLFGVFCFCIYHSCSSKLAGSFFLSSKFCPKYTFRTTGSLASCSEVPDRSILPSKSKYARSVIDRVS